MKTNPLLELSTLGQSIWLDYIKRDLFASGQLKKLIKEDGLKGMTSNPSLFEKAMTEGEDYDEQIQDLLKHTQDVTEIYEALAIKDVQDAADEFRDLYNQLNGKDGYVSLEVNPHLAHDTEKTIEEARRLWQAVDRPNVFIKVPATKEGLPAIEQLISDGINVNVTLLFGLPRYREVAEAYINGIEARVKQGEPVDHVTSVASFFLSRIDVCVDPLLKKYATHNPEASKLVGEIAIDSAKCAYEIYLELFRSERFLKLAKQGAKVQRLLWASTGTKNPEYSDVKYVEALIGPDTVNTVPMETLDAYRDHGNPQSRLMSNMKNAELCMQTLSSYDIHLREVTQQLENEGVEKFNKAYDQLIAGLKNKIKG